MEITMPKSLIFFFFWLLTQYKILGIITIPSFEVWESDTTPPNMKEKNTVLPWGLKKLTPPSSVYISN